MNVSLFYFDGVYNNLFDYNTKSKTQKAFTVSSSQSIIPFASDEIDPDPLVEVNKRYSGFFCEFEPQEKLVGNESVPWLVIGGTGNSVSV